MSRTLHLGEGYPGLMNSDLSGGGLFATLNNPSAVIHRILTELNNGYFKLMPTMQNYYLRDVDCIKKLYEKICVQLK